MSTIDRFKARRLLARFKAAAQCTECDDPVTAALGEDIELHGLAMPYGLATGDGRMTRPGALTWNLTESSVPLIWDRYDGDHSAMIVGKVDALRADDSGLYVERARLLGTDDPEAGAAVARVAELIEAGALGWSVNLDDVDSETTYRESVMVENGDGSVTVRSSTSDVMTVITAGQLRHIALVDTPAFPGARPILGPMPVNAAAAMVATYPAEHFERWHSDSWVPLTVDPDGRVWGHGAGGGCFRGNSKVCQTYSADPDPKMKNFHTGTATLSNGSVIRVGALTAAALHADALGPVEAQRRHHEDSSTVWAKVVAWDDERGRLCVSGSVVPGLSETFMAQVAGLPISVEKWPVPGVSGLTLVGAHTVNTPAWPV